MFLNEASGLNQLHYGNSRNCNRGGVEQKQSTTVRNDNDLSRRLFTANNAAQRSTDAMTAEMLDSANNRLQELMQLLYLLSRDPGVPQDARYHVTVAQSEIALLAREMRNTAENQIATTTGSNVSAAQP
jgi:hypothetical protein